MKRSTMLFSLLMFLLCISSASRAQDSASLFTRLEASIKQKEPSWKLVRKQVRKNSDSVFYEWRSGNRSVGVLILVHASLEGAIRTYKGLRFDFEAHGLKMVILQANVPNLGDENYLWEDDNNKEITGIDFRKGKVFVHVSTRSMEIAKRFALNIADEIPTDP
jgi:hypothetical protein